jgi:predicted nucleic acid-binding protein
VRSAIVIDSSVVVCAVISEDHRSEAAFERLSRGEALFAPALIDYEVNHALRRMSRVDPLIARRIDKILDNVSELPIQRTVFNRHLLKQVLSHRDNLSAYDASYAVLAASLDTTWVTADVKAASATTLPCAVEIIR